MGMERNGRSHGERRAALASVENIPVRAVSVSYGGHHGAQHGGSAVAAFSGVLAYKWTILLTFVLLAGAFISLVWLVQVPTFEARGMIQVEPVVRGADRDSTIPFYQQFLNTQVGIIRSPDVLNRVLEEPAVRATKWAKAKSAPLIGNPKGDMDRLLDDLLVRVRPQTQFIDVVMTTESRSDAIAIVQAILVHYDQLVRDQAMDTSQDEIRMMRAKVQLAQQEVDNIAQKIAEKRLEMNTVDPESVAKHKQGVIAEREQELARLKLDLGVLESIYGDAGDPATQPAAAAGASTTAPAAAPGAPVVAPAIALDPPAATADAAATTRPAHTDARRRRYMADPEWRNLDRAVEVARADLANNEQRLGDKNPKIGNLRNALAFAELMRERRELFIDEQAQSAGGPVAEASFGVDIKTRQREFKRRSELLREQVQADYQSLQKFIQAARVYDTLQRQKVDADQQYEDWKRRLERKETERQTAGAIKVYKDMIIAPTNPASDRRIMFTGMSIFGALTIAIGVGYLRYTGNRAVRGASDLRRATHSPFLGQLPLMGAAEMAKAGPDGCPISTEYMRMVRTTLLQRVHAGGPAPAVLVTSAGPGAGKTTVCAMLGKSLAHCGKKVLLVEGDLRNPRVSRHFKFNGGSGLVAALQGENPKPQQVLLSVGRLDVLPAGTVDIGRDAELLANGGLKTALDRWRSEYDVIIIDSPPVLPVADARILAQFVDGIIMVVREGSCRRDEVIEAVHSLSGGGELLGTIFIGRSELGAYGRYGGYGPYAYRPRRPEQEADAGAPVSAAADKQ